VEQLKSDMAALKKMLQKQGGVFIVHVGSCGVLYSTVALTL
jgi:hypothetical protein